MVIAGCSNPAPDHIGAINAQLGEIERVEVATLRHRHSFDTVPAPHPAWWVDSVTKYEIKLDSLRFTKDSLNTLKQQIIEHATVK